jgi:hypothetical protein
MYPKALVEFQPPDPGPPKVAGRRMLRNRPDFEKAKSKPRCDFERLRVLVESSSETNRTGKRNPGYSDP